MKETIPETAEISMGTDNILRIKLLPKSDIKVEDAKKIVDASVRISGGKKHCNLVDTREMLFMNNEARKHFAKQERSTLCAVGVIINSKFQSSLANLYLKFSNPVIPTKIFDNETNTIEWLKSKMR